MHNDKVAYVWSNENGRLVIKQLGGENTKPGDENVEHPIIAPTKPVGIGYGVYADFDGEAPDTDNLIVLSSLVLAEQVAKLLNDKRSTAYYVEGSEWAKRWTVCETLAYVSDIVTSYDKAVAMLSDDFGDDEDDDDEDNDDS